MCETRGQKRLREYLICDDDDNDIGMKHSKTFCDDENSKLKLTKHVIFLASPNTIDIVQEIEEPPKKVPRLLNGKYFEIVESSGRNISVKCLVPNCHKIRKGTLTSTGNYMDHIKIDHPEILEEVELYKKNRTNTDNLKQTTLTLLSKHKVFLCTFFSFQKFQRRLYFQ